LPTALQTAAADVAVQLSLDTTAAEGLKPLSPIDSRVVGIVENLNFAASEAKLNPLLVEDLLASCLSRISNCLELREKAHALQGEAIVYGSEKQALQDHLEDEKVRRSQLALIDRFFTIPGHALNFVERFDFLNSMFELNFKEAYVRAKLVAKGLDEVYGINTNPLPAVSATGYLDELTIWAQKVSDELDAELDHRRLSDIIVPLKTSHNPVFPGDYAAALPLGDFNFKISDEYFANLLCHEPRIRSLALEMVTPADSTKRHWAAEIEIKYPADSPTRAVKFPIVGTNGGPEESRLHAVTDAAYNLTPVAAWHINLPTHSTEGEALSATTITNLRLHLRVSARPRTDA